MDKLNILWTTDNKDIVLYILTMYAINPMVPICILKEVLRWPEMFWRTFFVSLILIPFTPFVRFLYKSLKMLNNFPQDLARDIPNQHRLLRELFDYEPGTLEMEIRKRMKENKL